MNTKKHQILVGIVTLGLTLAVPAVWAQAETPRPDRPATTQPDKAYGHDQPGKMMTGHYGEHLATSDLVGKDIKDSQGKNLGEVKDVIVNLQSGQASFAVIGFGGALGLGETRVAVPLNALRCTTTGTDKTEKELSINATKEQLQAASKTPSGAWTSVANQPWAKKIDGFYGQPQHGFRPDAGDRERVRDPLDPNQRLNPERQTPGQHDPLKR